MTRHCPELDSTSDWLKQISLTEQPIRSRYPDLGSDNSSRWETSGGVAKCRLFYQANVFLANKSAYYGLDFF